MSSYERDPLLRIVAEDELTVYRDGAEQTSRYYVKSTLSALDIGKTTGNYIDFTVFHALCYLAKRSPRTGLLYAITSVRELQKAMAIPGKKESPSTRTISDSLERLKKYGFVSLKLYNQKESLYILSPRGGVHKFGSDQDTKEKLDKLIVEYEFERNNPDPLRSSNCNANNIVQSEPDPLCSKICNASPKLADSSENRAEFATQERNICNTPINIDKINTDNKTTTTDEPGCSSELQFVETDIHNLQMFDLPSSEIPFLLKRAGSVDILNEALKIFDENAKRAAEGTANPIGDRTAYLLAVIDRVKECPLQPKTPKSETETILKEAAESEEPPDPRTEAYFYFVKEYVSFFKNFPHDDEKDIFYEFYDEKGKTLTPEEVRCELQRRSKTDEGQETEAV